VLETEPKEPSNVVPLAPVEIEPEADAPVEAEIKTVAAAETIEDAENVEDPPVVAPEPAAKTPLGSDIASDPTDSNAAPSLLSKIARAERLELAARVIDIAPRLDRLKKRRDEMGRN
jgi:hypothetical protein